MSISMPSASANRQNQSGKASTVLIVLGVLFLVFVIGGVGCYFMVKTGLDMVAQEVKKSVKDDPLILEHIGDIRDISLNFGATTEAGGGQRMVFDLSGSKGSGKLTATVVTEGSTTTVTSHTLTMDDGTLHEFPKAEAPPADAPPAGTTPDDTPPK